MPKKPSKTLREWCIENKREDLLEEWDYEKNCELGYTPDNVTPFKNKDVFWNCKTCGGNYPAKISKRTTNRNCPYCAGKKVLKGINDFETWCKNNNMQHLLDEWDYDINTIKPYETVPFSHIEIQWKCPICEGKYPLHLSSRTKGKQNCPYCAHQRILKGYNDFETFCKKENRLELLHMWSPQNKLTPSDVFPTSRDEVEWVCQNGHIWKSSIANMTTRMGDFCPICFSAGSSFLEKIIAFYIKKYFNIKENYRPKFLNNKEIDIYIPELKIGIEYDGNYYHKDIKKDVIKNELCKQNNITIIRIREYGLQTINNCKCFLLSQFLKSGYPENFETTIYELLLFFGVKTPEINLKDDYSSFLDFAKKTISENNLQNWCINNNTQHILDEWHPIKNGTLNPRNVSPKTNTKVWWICTNCNYEYPMSISARTQSEQNCPRCQANNKLFKGYNDLETWCKQNNRLDILENWDYDLNDISPSDITAHNTKKVYWKCEKCKNSYLCNIAHYTAGTSGCPICAGRRPVRCIEINQEFKGPTEASMVVFGDKKKKRGIVLCCRGEQKTAGGYHWEYIDKENNQEKEEK